MAAVTMAELSAGCNERGLKQVMALDNVSRWKELKKSFYGLHQEKPVNRM
ncbi:hypothetical protein SAMN05443252_107204 [Bacillus sp. OV322]|nr:hypothetical protein [Bacillus sp. OV322]SFC87751.1 hypothetical protein SAMN05443252_107204 [Bacillus sp. OV322]